MSLLMKMEFYSVHMVYVHYWFNSIQFYFKLMYSPQLMYSYLPPASLFFILLDQCMRKHLELLLELHKC